MPTGSHHDGRFLERDSVEIRWLALDRVGADDWPALERLLDEGERDRAGRFRREHDRRAYIAGHALVRAMLSRCAPVPPAAWRFAANAYGRPEILRQAGTPPLRFNLTHTRGLAAAAVTFEGDIGLDAEWLDRPALTMDLAARSFAPAEIEYLAKIPADRRKDALFGLWTLKEAYVKAVGRGLSLPLDAFAFAMEPLRISFSPPIEDAPDGWLFRRFRPTPSHAMALALRHPEPRRVVVIGRPAGKDLLPGLSMEAGAATAPSAAAVPRADLAADFHMRGKP